MPIGEPMNLPVKRKAGIYYEAVTLAMLRLRQLLLANWWQGRIKHGLTDCLTGGARGTEDCAEGKGMYARPLFHVLLKARATLKHF